SGKTTAALNLGIALRYCQKDVTVVDANLHNPNISMHLGAPQVPIHLNHVLQGKHTIHDAVYQHRSGIKIVPASLSLQDASVSARELRNHVKSLQTDILLLDTPSGLHENALHALHAADEALLITQPEWPAVADGLKTLQILRHYQIPCHGVLVNKAGSKHDIPTAIIEDTLKTKVVATIPFDSNMRWALRRKEPLVFLDPHSPAAESYIQLAKHLIGRQEPRERKFLGLF
ncbi:MAG: P-loop NTPase, partial [Nanoarchaeota archaeon]